MRKRSNTINADSYQEFLDLSISQSPALSDPSAFIESPYCYLPSNPESYHEPLLYADSSETMFSDIDKPLLIPPDSKDKEDREDLDEIMYIEASEDESASLSTQADSLVSSSIGSIDRVSSSYLDGRLSPKIGEISNEELHKIMIIGNTGTGRHGLINSLFGETVIQNKEEPKLRNAMDLLIRTKKEKGQAHKFKLWIRDPNCQRFDPLIRVYYKSINYYIFVYKTTDAKSLECAEKAIQEVLAEASGECFKGLLLANNQSNAQEREVTWEQGEFVRQKYGLRRLIEVDDMQKDAQKVEQELKELVGW